MALVKVRATIHLPGIQCGQQAVVDTEEPYIKACIARGNLVIVGPAKP